MALEQRSGYFWHRAVLVLLLTGFCAFASIAHSAPSKTLGNPDAPRGGRFTYNLGGEPPTLNPVTSQDVYASEVQGFVLEALQDRNPDTYEWEPSLALKVETSKDGKEFTATLRDGIVFSDGKPVTAEDVKFSFDVMFDDTYKAVHRRPYYEGIAKVEVLDAKTIKFTAKEPYFLNYDVVSGMYIIPKHIYGNAREGVKLNKTILGSGPYVLGEYEKGKRMVLKRNPKWWGWNEPRFKGAFNFDEIQLRFVKEEQVNLEMLKTGQVDSMSLGAEAYMKKTVGEVWEKNVIKHKYFNKQAQGYGFVGWNLKEPMFQDRRTRVALAHLMNRELMNEKFLFNMAKLATGPWYQDSIYASPKVKPIEFSPEKARKLLAEAGWADSDKDGVLDKEINGKRVRFQFSLLNTSKDFEKYLTVYKEDLQKAGILMDIQYLEWNSFIKLLDERKFSAVCLGWGGGAIDIDPKGIWHSSGADAPGSNNFIGYKNPEVDKLIDQARGQMKREDRVKTLQKVYELIAADAPYAFFFNRKFFFYAHRKNIGMPKEAFQFGDSTNYWWFEPAKP